MIIFGVISQSVIVFAFGAVQVMILYVQNRIIYKYTRNRLIDKIQNMWWNVDIIRSAVP